MGRLRSAPHQLLGAPIPPSAAHGEGGGLGAPDTWVFFPQGDADLIISTDDWHGERASKLLRLGDILHLQAELHAKNHGPLRVLVDACEATARGDGTSGPRHTLVAHNG